MRKVIYILSLALAAACACAQKGDGIPEQWPWLDPDADNEPWVEVTDGRFGDLPAGIRIYHSPDALNGRKAEAWIATADLSKTSFHVWGLDDPELDGCMDNLLTPAKVYEGNGSPVLVINGGFFYSEDNTNYPASLAVENGVMLSPNINYASEDWVTMYYPTRAAFIRHASGTMEAAWTYFKNAESHWIYQVPAQNDYGSDPQPTPSATFPAEGASFEAQTAIGAGPVLLKAGKIMDTWRYECIPGDYDVNCVNPDPRSAIGCTADGLLVLFVCEGREMTEGVKGYSTADVARILQEFGCTEAINLDGGGSSCLLVNGQETIKPSDGKQRSVGSCIYIK
ncbi:MAG: phosphodiester glycosidase family protein [Bacteroidales bacterium]|nr:phosphodiester glycosidase family protein [Bacteroidales bacterium]MBR6306276.1 phosphodiester glycosidase family protein [Bacteroidales bacterium]